MKKVIYSIIMLAFYANIYGQAMCGSELNLSKLQQTDPARYQRFMAVENQIHTSLRSATSHVPQSTIIIPVVVHLVWKKPEWDNFENGDFTRLITDEQIEEQIKVLNEDFRRKNRDRINTPLHFAEFAADANIEFKLAIIDPEGKPTNGITRTQVESRYVLTNGVWEEVPAFHIGTDAMKFAETGHAAWDTQKYLNIWVCKMDIIPGYKNPLAGYAQFPADLGTRPNTDGVVIDYKILGRESSSLYLGWQDEDHGRRVTHEVGHWLNLIHIWGGDDGDVDTCSGSDEVSDTPNQSLPTDWYQDVTSTITDECSPQEPGIMFMNYMDYTRGAGMNMFTKGQVDRMRALFDSETGVRRAMMKTAASLTPPPVPPCLPTTIQNKTYPSTMQQLMGINTFNLSGCHVVIANTTVKSRATLNVTATERITLKPGFRAQKGSYVYLKIGSSTLSSSINEDSINNINNDVIDDIRLGVEEVVLDTEDNRTFDIRYYPNPFQDNVSFELTLRESAKISVSIFDVNGVLQKHLLLPTEYLVGTHTLTYRLSELKTGVYLCTINVGNRKSSVKLLKK